MHGSEHMACLFVQLIVYLCLYTNVYCLAESPENDSRMPSANSSGSQQSLPDLASLCPYNRFCRSSPIKEISATDEVPCCEECSCDYDCHETGRCCPDMPLAGIVKPKYPCIQLSTLGNNKDFDDDTREYFYNVITDCSDMLKAVSYPECYQPKEVQDFVIVSDPETGLVYRNKHCAECNNVQNYIYWKLGVDCPLLPQLMYVGSFAERDRYLLENCSLLPLPEEGHTADISRCIPDSDVRKSCNVTMEWDVYDSKIEDACMRNREDQNALFVKDSGNRGKHIYYASVYCYLCNVAKDSNKKDVCKRITNTGGRGGFVSLFAILDFKIMEEAEIHDFRCRSPEMWDPYKKLCRPLICPSGRIPVYGTCKGTFSNIEGYTIAIHFEVLFLTGSMAANEEILQVLENRFFWELGNDLTCGRCLSSFFSENNSPSTLYLRLEVFSTDKCQDDTMLKRIREIAMKKKMYVQFNFEGQRILVELKFFPKDVYDGGWYELPVSKTYGFCGDAKVIDSSILQYCPRIKLTKEEAYTIGINNISENIPTLSSQTNDTKREFQEVCIDKYFALNKERSAGISTFPRDMFCTKNVQFQILIFFIGYFSEVL